MFEDGFSSPDRRRLVLIAAILASAMGFIDGSVVAIAMPDIRAGLGASLFQATWISNAYLVALAALTLAGGAIGDRFGTARIFALGIGVFVATSILCALATSPEMLILARAAQGVGAALMVPGSLAVISRSWPRNERGRAIGIWAAAASLTTGAGPLVGGIILTVGEAEAWRWIFALNLPLGAVALLFLRAGVIRDARRPGRGVDLAGAALASGGLGLIAWGLTRLEAGGTAWGLPLLSGIGLLVVFVVHEGRTVSPMMPLELFRIPVFSAANVSTFCLYFGLTAVVFYLPMLTVAGWGLAEIEAAAPLLPLTVFLTLLSSRFGAMADRVGPGRLIAVGGFLSAVGYAAAALGAQSQSFWWGIMPAMVILGFGMSMVVAPLSAAVMTAAPDADSGAASGINNAVSRMAGLVAVAAMGSLAAIVYASAGGTESYGVAADGDGHIAAMNAAFSAIAWVAAVLSTLGAAMALAAIPRTQTG